MKTTQKRLLEREKYQKEMSELQKKLPKNWVKTIMDRRKRIAIVRYHRMYRDLVNAVNGRSLKAYKRRRSLMKEVYELASNRSINNGV